MVSGCGTATCAERARLRRIMNHDTMAAIKVATAMPPAVPPPIAPIFELPLRGEFDDVDEDEDV